MRDCGFNIFEDCNCGSQCKSAAIDLGRFQKANRLEPAERTVKAKHFAGRAVNAVLIPAYIGIAIGCAFSLINLDQHYKREARANQEQIAWQK
jgi:hypothetical protein